MGARLREDIVQIENQVAGSRCLVSIPTGRMWLDWHIEHGGLTLAQMTNIKVFLISPTKTVQVQEYKDGTELNEINKRYGRYTAAGTLSFYWRKPEMENEAQSMATALGTGGLLSVRVEFDIAPATTPVIKAWGRKTANRAVWEGILPYVSVANIGGQVQGDTYYDGIEKRDRMIALHVLNTNVSGLQLKLDDAVVFNLTRARGEYDERVGGRVPYASNYGMVIDFTTSGVLDEALILQDYDGSGRQTYQAQALRLTATLGASPSSVTRFLTEYLSTWQSLAGSNVQQVA